MGTAKSATPLYGLLGHTHGWAKVLTVMSPLGITAARAAVTAGEDVIVEASPGHLTRYYEKRDGALQRLAEVNGIEILDKADWDAKKAECGDRIRD
jgi:hypothetical protein